MTSDVKFVAIKGRPSGIAFRVGRSFQLIEFHFVKAKVFAEFAKMWPIRPHHLILVCVLLAIHSGKADNHSTKSGRYRSS